jgi:hypothetical protein
MNTIQHALTRPSSWIYSFFIGAIAMLYIGIAHGSDRIDGRCDYCKYPGEISSAFTGPYVNINYPANKRNDWHYVSITSVDANRLKWNNRAGVSWDLKVHWDRQSVDYLEIGPNPYSNAGYTKAKRIGDSNGEFAGFVGPHNEVYVKVRWDYQKRSYFYYDPKTLKRVPTGAWDLRR